ncbi:hypothetical protein TIFTF001_019412 [Ficus carica]|uniref:Uncharacterized protein n=1 Tax=Ficus carica TaxID=3494 RepID=A0AA88A8Z3_FICCA|nr:hypothetical protein TIFTF001_019412 [Ficus carica]
MPNPPKEIKCANATVGRDGGGRKNNHGNEAQASRTGRRPHQPGFQKGIMAAL